MSTQSFLTARNLAEIANAFDKGFHSIQEVQDPQPVVTFRRIVAGAMADVLTVNLIRIAFVNRFPIASGENMGMDQTDKLGSLLGFAPLPIQLDDRFTWQGRHFRITSVMPARFGVVDAGFELAEGNV